MFSILFVIIRLVNLSLLRAIRIGTSMLRLLIEGVHPWHVALELPRVVLFSGSSVVIHDQKIMISIQWSSLSSLLVSLYWRLQSFCYGFKLQALRKVSDQMNELSDIISVSNCLQPCFFFHLPHVLKINCDASFCSGLKERRMGSSLPRVAGSS